MQTRRLCPSRLLGAALSLAAVAMGFGTGTASAAASCPGWAGAQPPGSGNLLRVTVLSACEFLVVGCDGGPDKSGALIEHWTGGSSWTVMNNPSPGSVSRLFTAAGAAANDVWAVGEYEPVGSSHLTGLIEHWDGSSWAQFQSPVPGVGGNLLGVGAVSANDAWAVGFSENATDGGPSVVRTLIEHWDGSQWTPDAQAPSPGTSSFLVGISAASATNIWAVGASVNVNPNGTTSDTALIEHWDGTGWSVSRFSPPGITSALSGVKVVSATNIWAVGRYRPDGSSSDKTLIEHWDGANWTLIPSPSPGGQLNDVLFSVTATSATSAWSAGRGGGDPLLLHWDGDAWSRVATPSAAAGDYLGAVQASPDGATWIAGGGQSAFAAPVLGAAQAEIAVNALGRNLRETGFVNGPPGNLSVAAGTGPVVAATPARDFKVAWTAANDHLWTIDQAGHRTDTMTLVRAGTSPAITALSGSGYEIAFTGAADGQLWETGPDGVVRVAAGGVAVAPGTSPAIAASPAGGFEIAVHSAGSGDLTIVTPDGVVHDSGRQVAPGTRPALAALATGGFEVAFTGADGQLWRAGPDAVFTLAGGGGRHEPGHRGQPRRGVRDRGSRQRLGRHVDRPQR